MELAGIVGREVILREAMAKDEEPFDFVLMDCGPSLGVLTLNALAAADEVFIPLQPHFLALHGLSQTARNDGPRCPADQPRLKRDRRRCSASTTRARNSPRKWSTI